jgi:predicted DCC family thiol-disulfide oxidoreductase YuxK
MRLPTLTLFYDGLCPLCSREIALFRRRAAGDPSVVFVDITDPSFDASAHGLEQRPLHRVMHVKVGEEVRSGVDAFVAIWQRIPGFGWLALLSRIPGMRLLLKAGYALFARVRPWLPRRKSRCSADVCQR